MSASRKADETELVCVARLGKPFGVHGLMHLHSYTHQDTDIERYERLYHEDGRLLGRITQLKPGSKGLICQLSGVRGRSAAEALAGVKLFVHAADLLLPDEEDEWLYRDLLGLAVLDQAGNRIGAVANVVNYGAGDLLEVEFAAGGRRELLPFTREYVPEVKLSERIIVIAPPPGLFE